MSQDFSTFRKSLQYQLNSLYKSGQAKLSWDDSNVNFMVYTIELQVTDKERLTKLKRWLSDQREANKGKPSNNYSVSICRVDKYTGVRTLYIVDAFNTSLGTLK